MPASLQMQEDGEEEEEAEEEQEAEEEIFKVIISHHTVDAIRTHACLLAFGLQSILNNGISMNGSMLNCLLLRSAQGLDAASQVLAQRKMSQLLGKAKNVVEPGVHSAIKVHGIEHVPENFNDIRAKYGGANR